MVTERRKLRKILVWYAFALACVTTLAIATILAIRDSALGVETVLSSIGLNLIASVVFALVFTALSNWAQQGAIEEAIEEHVVNATTKLRDEIASMNLTYLPIATYPPLDPSINGYGDQFNVDMTRSLERTAFYAFCGPSARYVAARLRKARSYPREVRVAMLNPGDSSAISRRSSDRLHWVRSAGKSASELENELRDELIMSVVSLFDYRKICPVQLLYVEDTAVYRYEMFDDSVFVSWYHGPRSTGKEMPESLRFASRSFLYDTMRLDLIRRFEISVQQVAFKPTHDEEYLATHLTKQLGISVRPSDLRKWRDRYEVYTSDFSLYLGRVYKTL